MAQVRICDRCQAPAGVLEEKITMRSFTVPRGAPSTRPVDTDLAVTMGFRLTQDFCPICLTAVIIACLKAQAKP